MEINTNLSSDQTILVSLRPVHPSDMEVFFEQQLDLEANEMAAFTAKDPTDQETFQAHWDKIQADPTITIWTILYKKQIAGYILSHGWFGNPEVSYWIGKEFWGQGVTTQALRLFLEESETRPLYARVAKDNIASTRVLLNAVFRRMVWTAGTLTPGAVRLRRLSSG